MGTLAEVSIWAEDDSTSRAAADSAFAVFAAVDSLLSTWNGNSPLSRLNAAPVGTWVSLGREACGVLAQAAEVSARTGGAFDPAVLPLVKLWGFRGGEPQLPSAEALAAALVLVDVQALEVQTDRARRLRDGLALDLGGIAKGYALDRARAKLQGCGVSGAVLDLGGNLLAFGTGAGRTIGVVDPAAPDFLLLSIPLDGAVATSGQYERFVSISGQAYGHILDPRTGWPVRPGLSVTVLSAEAVWGDALATAAVVLGPEAGLALLEGWPGVEGVVVTANGVQVTSGLRPALISP
jgi:thiamine biosynthesis lipoprotein